MTGRRLLVRSVTSIVLAAGGVSCRDSARDAASLPAGPPVVTVNMREYRFDYRGPVAAGRVVFRFVNAGRRAHQPDLIALAEDLPSIDEQVRGDERVAVTQFAGIPPRTPGEVGTYAVDLVPGQRYAIICFARSPRDESHALKGMTTEFRAGGGTSPPAASSPPSTGR